MYVLFAAQSLEGPITEEKLSQLLNLTKFEAINTGVHVFLPMDWVVGTASLSANAPLQSKRRLYPHVRDIYPITSPSLPKGRNDVASSNLNDKRYYICRIIIYSLALYIRKVVPHTCVRRGVPVREDTYP